MNLVKEKTRTGKVEFDKKGIVELKNGKEIKKEEEKHLNT